MKHLALAAAFALPLAACTTAQTAAAPEAPTGPPLAEQVETVAAGYGFVEGPAVGPDGAVYFTDMPAKVIARFDPATGKAQTWREDSGRANGLSFNPDGELFAAEGGRHRVAKYVPEADGHAAVSTPIVDKYDGKLLNQPNDVAADAHGGVYFTDPDFNDREGEKPGVEGVYYVNAAGDITLLTGDHERPNGVALSPDGKTLYTQDVKASVIHAHDVVAPGRVQNSRVFADVSDIGEEKKGGPDGLCIDTDGNVYSALFRGGAVAVYDKDGNRLQVIPTGPQTTNCVLDEDESYLYVTADKQLKRIKLR